MLSPSPLSIHARENAAPIKSAAKVNPISCHGRSRALSKRLHQPLVQHRIGDFEEAADVGSVDQVAGRAVHLGRLVAGLVDGDHDLVQTIVHFLAGPE